MNTTTAALVLVVAVVAVLAAVHVPFGDYMARVYSSPRHTRMERGVYRLVGVDPRRQQTWGVYARSVLAFSAVSILFLYSFQRLQGHLPLSLGFGGVPPAVAFDTAVSFVTNTNWQAYSGESTMGHLVQMAGLAVQNFTSAAVGMAVAAALVRGFASRRGEQQLGNFWVDLTRTCVRILLPVAFVGAIVFVAAGAVQNFSAGTPVRTLAGAAQVITGGPVASQEVIKELGTNGGGFYNVNSAHPFENPTGWTNALQILLLLVISFSLPRTFGTLIGDKRQGVAIVAVMAIILTGSLAADEAAVPVRGDAPAVPVVPADAVTASGSDLDPDISPPYADLQAARVAKVRGLPADRVRKLIRAHTEGRALGFLGEPGVDVLRLNLELDRVAPVT